MSKKVKIGIAGIGRAGYGMHCEELKGKEDKFEIVAACDLIDERREKMAKRYECKVYENIEDMIKDPDVELVDIATRSADHYEHAMMALNIGKDVFLEKPMCLTYEQAQKLKEAGTKENGPRLYIRHNRRFEPGFMRVREIIESGILGNIFEIKMCRYGYGRRDDWQTLLKHGGGQLLNWGPHIIDQSLQFLGGRYEKVDCQLKNMVAVGDAEDHVKIIFTGYNGMTIDMEISGGVAISAPEYLVYGDRGSLSLSGDRMYYKYLNKDNPLPLKVANPGTPGTGFGTPEELDWIEVNEEIDNANDITLIWDKLYDALVLDKEFPIHINQALAVMEVVDKVKSMASIIKYDR